MTPSEHITEPESGTTEPLVQHWRKGIPTLFLVLGGLALFGYSYTFVQPNLAKRYAQLTDRQLKTLGLAEGLQSVTEIHNDSSPISLNESERLNLLEDTQLCLRRLIAWNNSDDAIVYRLAVVSDALANEYLSQSRSIPVADREAGKTGKYAELEANSRGARKRAFDSMVRVEKMGGPFADQAGLWLAHQQMSENSVISTADLLTIENKLREIISREPRNEVARTDLAKVLLIRALRIANDLSVTQRRDMLRDVDTTCDAIVPRALPDMARAALAKSASAPEKSHELAWKATQFYWANNKGDTESSQVTNATFACMVLTQSLKESQSYLARRLPQLDASQQQSLRNLSGASCVHILVARSLCSEASSIPSNYVAILNTAIQLNPESEELADLLVALAQKEPGQEWLVPLADEILNGNDEAQRQLLLTIRSLINLDGNLQPSSAANALKRSASSCVVMSKVAMKLADEGKVPANELIGFLAEINQAVPDVLTVWADRAKLHLLAEEPEKALKCYEFLHTKLPDNKDIASAIGRIKQGMKAKK